MVPASNFHGTSFHLEPVSFTSRIISPPPRNGGIASSHSRRAHSAPIPVGPSILWLVKATKSAPSARTSTGQCGTLCDASTTNTAPAACAWRAISATGFTVPSTFEMWTTETSFTRPSASSAGSASSASSPSRVTGMKRSSIRRSSARSCHGTRLEWCSISVSTIASPASSRERPHEWATRFRASVLLRVNTISRGEAAPTNRATRRRASS